MRKSCRLDFSFSDVKKYLKLETNGMSLKAEWDEMLNTIDCAKPNHSDIDANVELGESAGSELKSTKY